MTEPTKDKGNGKDQQPVPDVEPYLMIGRLKSTGQVTLTGPPINDLVKFKERKTKDELLDILFEAEVLVRKLSKQVQKKSSILTPVKRIFLPGGNRG